LPAIPILLTKNKERRTKNNEQELPAIPIFLTKNKKQRTVLKNKEQFGISKFDASFSSI
jgi:hypothetical protein